MTVWATFDCYGTLIDWEKGIGDVLIGTWPLEDRAGLLASYARAEREIQTEDPAAYRHVLARAMRRVAEVRGLPLAAGEEERLPESLRTWEPFPEVPGALWRARAQGWRLAVLSNTDPDLLAGSLRSIGVHFDMTVTFEDTGSYKPDTRHWEVFFDRSGVERARHVHVAASLYHDIAPCAQLGLRAIWVNRAAESTDLPLIEELADLSALPEALTPLKR